MQSLKLDYLNTTSDPNSLPEELIERCAACEAKPTIVQDLIGSVGKLTEAHRDVEYMMKEIMALIEEEEKADEEFQIVVSTHRGWCDSCEGRCDRIVFARRGDGGDFLWSRGDYRIGSSST